MKAEGRRIVIGTRGSSLALWQAHAVEAALLGAFPGLEVRIEVIRTTGDRNLATPLDRIGDRGLFTKELEGALVAGDVDVCVHSMKDVQSQLARGCAIVGTLPRADVRDALVCGPRIAGATHLEDLPAGTRLATGSLRRVAQLRAQFPTVVPTPVRGNVETRVRKALGEDFEGAILACAGLERLGMERHIAARLEPSVMIPAVGQGAIGIEAREGDEATVGLVRAISDDATYRCVRGERRVLAALNGSCRVPMGAYARLGEGAGGEARLLFDAFVSTTDGTRQARSHLELPQETDPFDAAGEALDELLSQGAREIRDSIETTEVQR